MMEENNHEADELFCGVPKEFANCSNGAFYRAFELVLSTCIDRRNGVAQGCTLVRAEGRI